MNNNKLQEWAVIRLATIRKKNEASRLLFATITILNHDRPLPPAMDGLDHFDIKKSKETIYFRRVIQSKEEAENWYRSLGGNKNLTPVPTRDVDRKKKYDGIEFDVSALQDDCPWPQLGLPLQQQDLFTHNKNYFINPAPFIGSIPAHLHRRFGSKESFDGFIQDKNAVIFVKRRLHIDLEQYREYLGSVVYISPDPVLKQIDNFMIPAKDNHGERIIYRFIPYPGQTLKKLKLTEFSIETGLLTSFKTYSIPDNNILIIDKGICRGLYGFVISHDDGVLAYQPPCGFLRQMNTNIFLESGQNIIVQTPTGSAKNSPQMEYQASRPFEQVSNFTVGDKDNDDINSRVNQAVYERNIIAEAKHYGQHWFSENSREITIKFIHNLIRSAHSHVIIADPYFGPLQIHQYLYAIYAPNISVKIYTTKLALETNQKEKNNDPVKEFQDALDQLNKHQRFSPEVRILPVNKLHDRFLIVDDKVWFVGNSLNSIGDKASMIIRLPNPSEVINQLDEIIKNSKSLDEYKANRDKKTQPE